MEIDISQLPYKHRFAAATMLMSKGDRLTDIEGLPSDPLDDKQIQKVLQGLSFYDMALSLIKPHDPNYQTLLNWKCQTLILLKQFEDARKWYERLVQIAMESEGPNCLGATATYAQEQIAYLAGKSNQPLPEVDDLGVRTFDDPPFCLWAEEIVRLLQARKYKQVHRCLSSQLGSQLSAADLKQMWTTMLGDASLDTTINLETFQLASEGGEERHIGWCYFSVTNDQISEAISMDVYLTQSKGFEIGSIEFGRP